MIKAKSLKSVLVIPNITFQKDLEADSFVKVMREIIIGLDKHSPLNLWFHIPLPKYSKLLDFPNVTQYFIDFPTYPNSMRAHFNYYDWMKIIDWKNQDFDIIYSHLPEQTLNVTNLISNTTNIGTLPIVGYCHWFEIKEITEYDKNFLLNNINGILEMEECGVNTQSQIDMVIDNVKDIYSEKTISRLREIMKPHYLGVQKEDVVDKLSDYENIIVFNHRPQAYKDFPNFMKIMDALWEKRQDFKVWIPLLDKPNAPYVITDKFEKEGYYDFLKKCCVGFAPKQKYAGWSVSVTDGIMNGCPYIFYDADYYEELIGKKESQSRSQTFFANNDAAKMLLNLSLDDKNFRYRIAKKQLDFCKENMTWEKRIPVISEMITKALGKTKSIIKGERKDDIIEFIKKNRQVTKSQILKHLGWGVGIKFASYRKFITENPNVVIKRFSDTLFEGQFYNKQTEYYTWEENNKPKPMDGIERSLLSEAIRKSAITTPTLKGRI